MASVAKKQGDGVRAGVRMRGLVKQVLPESAIARVRDTLGRLDQAVLNVCARTRWGSVLYYLLLSRAFDRELWAVAYGRMKYEEEQRLQLRSKTMVRRNIHRLEKGLIMRPRRSVFAVEYIEETVEGYAQQLDGYLNDATAVVDENEIAWARDVLGAYFEVVGGHPRIDRAKARFQTLPLPTVGGEGRCFAPYTRNISEPSPVSYDDLLALAQRRRSVRWFLPTPVPGELLDKAVGVAALSPSACNRQPFRFVMFDQPEQVQKVAAIPFGTAGFAHNFPAVVAVVGQQRAFFSERDRHVIYIDASLATMSFILALETLGLSSCCINWPDIESQERRITAALGLEPDERVVMLVAVGYPDPEGMVPYSAKKTLDGLREAR